MISRRGYRIRNATRVRAGAEDDRRGHFPRPGCIYVKQTTNQIQFVIVTRSPAPKGKRRPIYMEEDEAASQSHRQPCVSSSKTKRSVASSRRSLLLGMTCLVALCCAVTLLLCGAVFFCCWYVSAGRKKINGRQEETTDAAIPPPPGATARDQEPSLSLRPPAGPGPEALAHGDVAVHED